ncbi:MAG: phospholipase C [Nitrososphaerales archaeon]
MPGKFDKKIDRRDFLTGVGAAGALALGGSTRLRHHDHLRKAAHVRSRASETVKAAASVRAAGSDLGAVEHVIFLMHENRSFDHYFGTLGGVNGFDASSTAFEQNWPGGSQSYILPFRLDVKKQQAECTYDLSHAWQAQHDCWDGGKMDAFASTHTSSRYEGDLGVVTMGYYEKADIPLYYDLAKKFTVCDSYFCSVLGETHPNRLMHMTGTLDPAGEAGGPVLVTNGEGDPDNGVGYEFTCSWETMPEALSNKNVSWKVYNPYGHNYTPGSGLSMILCKNPLMYFEQYQQSMNPTLYQNAFGYYGPNVNNAFSGGTGPNDFAADVMNDSLPSVSWIIPPVGFDEHPPTPAILGEWFTLQILEVLASKPQVWEKTVLFIMYDENDGWFDHVPPPTAPSNTAGEYVTASTSAYNGGQSTTFAQGAPIGLGFRVPMLVVSPFSAGGWVCSDTFDHTSQLRFLETLFGVTVPNLSSWRRANTGDLTSALPTLSNPVTKSPIKGLPLPKISDSTTTPPISTECTAGQQIEVNSTPSNPPMVPKKQKQPKQHGKLTPTPS